MILEGRSMTSTIYSGHNFLRDRLFTIMSQLAARRVVQHFDGKRVLVAQTSVCVHFSPYAKTKTTQAEACANRPS